MMIYLFITLISLVMGFKIGSVYHLFKITLIKNQINKDNIEDSIKKQYDKKILKYENKIDILEKKLFDLTSEFSESDEDLI